MVVVTKIYFKPSNLTIQFEDESLKPNDTHVWEADLEDCTDFAAIEEETATIQGKAWGSSPFVRNEFRKALDAACNEVFGAPSLVVFADGNKVDWKAGRIEVK